MCLAVPAEVIALEGDMATIDVGGNTRRVSVALTPGAKVGDFVLIHAGYALETMNAEEARATLRLFEELNEAAAE